MSQLPPYLPQWLVCVFFAILFLQSGLDKAFYYQDNLNYFRDQFKNSPLAGSVSALLPVLLLLETVTGMLGALGATDLLLGRGATFAHWVPLAAGITLLALFFGQRMAKDYGGAAGIVPYFLVALAGFYFQP
jgi:hypothetical protein